MSHWNLSSLGGPFLCVGVGASQRGVWTREMEGDENPEEQVGKDWAWWAETVLHTWGGRYAVGLP